MLYTIFYMHCGHIRESPEQAQARSQATALAAPKSLWGRIKQSIKPDKDRSRLELVESWCPECMSIRHNTGYEPFQRSPRRSPTGAGPSGTQGVAQERERERERDDAGHRRAPDPRATAETLSLIENPEDLAALASLVAAQQDARPSIESGGSSSWSVHTPNNTVEQLTELQQLRLELLHDSDQAFRVLHRRLRHPAFATYGPMNCRDCDAVQRACLADYAGKQRRARNGGSQDVTTRVTDDMEIDAFLAADYWVELPFTRPESPPRVETPSLPENPYWLEGDIHVGEEPDIFEEVRDDLGQFVNLEDDEEEADISTPTTPTPKPRLGRDLLRHRPKMVFNYETCESTNDLALRQPEVCYDEDPLEDLDKFPFPPLEQSKSTFVVGDNSDEDSDFEEDLERSINLSDEEDVSPKTTPTPKSRKNRKYLYSHRKLSFDHDTCEFTSTWEKPRRKRVVHHDEDIQEALNNFRFPWSESSNGESSSKGKGKERESCSKGKESEVPNWSTRVPEEQRALKSAVSQPLPDQDEVQGAGKAEAIDAGKLDQENMVDPTKWTDVSDLPAHSLTIDDTEVSPQPESTVASRAASLAAIKSKWAAMMEKHAKWDEEISGTLAGAMERCPGEPDPTKWEPWIEVSHRIDATILQYDAIKARAIAEVDTVEDQETDTLAGRLDVESAPELVEQSTDKSAKSSSTSEQNTSSEGVAEEKQQPDAEFEGLQIDLVPTPTEASTDELADTPSTPENAETSKEVAKQEQDPDARIEELHYEFAPTLVEDSTQESAGSPSNLEETDLSGEAGQTGINIKNQDGASTLTSDNDTPAEEADDDSGFDHEGTAIVEEDSDGESEGAGFDGFDDPDFFGRFEDNERSEDEERSSRVPDVRDGTVERESAVFHSPESVELPPSPSPPQTLAESPISASPPLPCINPYTPDGQAAAHAVRSYYGVPPEVPLYQTGLFPGRPSFVAYHGKSKLKWKAPRRGKIHGRLVSQGPQGEYGLNTSRKSWKHRCEIYDLGARISWAAEPFPSVFEDSDVSENSDSGDGAEPKQETDEEDQESADADDAVSSSSSSSSSSNSDSLFTLSHLPLNANFHQQLEAIDDLFPKEENSVRAAFEAAFDELYDPHQPGSPSPDENVGSVSSLSPVSPLSDEEPVYDGLIVREVPAPTEAQEKLAYQPKKRTSLRKELLDDGSF